MPERFFEPWGRGHGQHGTRQGSDLGHRPRFDAPRLGADRRDQLPCRDALGRRQRRVVGRPAQRAEPRTGGQQIRCPPMRGALFAADNVVTRMGGGPHGQGLPMIEDAGLEAAGLWGLGPAELRAPTLTIGKRVEMPRWGRTRLDDSPTSLARIRPYWSAICSAAGREMGLAWAVLKNDIASGTYPGWFFTASAFLHTGAVDATVLAASFAYFTLGLYQFCLGNQILGVEEDKVNKRFRSMASGAMSIRGGWVRYVLASLAFQALGAALGVLPYTALWQVVSAMYNFLGWSKHWATRSCVLMTGVFAQQAAGWGMVMPVAGPVWTWICTTAVASYVFFNIQDFRDVEVDLTVGRRTLPILLGLAVCSRTMAFVMSTTGPAVPGWLFGLLRGGGPALAWQAAGCALCWVVAARLLVDGTLRGQHVAYGWYVRFYVLLLIGVFLLPPAGALA